MENLPTGSRTHTIRRADVKDLSEIYRMQNVQFRDKVFIEPMPSLDDFVKYTSRTIEAGYEHYYVEEDELGVVVGFIRYLKKDDWEALTWGKWLNTLVYASCYVGFDILNMPKLHFAVRDENKRVFHLYRKFGFRKLGQEFICYRKHLLAPIQTTGLTHYELTAEEYREKCEMMIKNSLALRFA